MFPISTASSRHKLDTRNPLDAPDVRPHKDRTYVHFADDNIRTSDDPNLKYTDETNAYTTISTRGHFTPNPRTTTHNTSPGRLYNSPTPSGNIWSRDHRHVQEEPSSEKSVKRDTLGIQERVQDASVPLSARSYELSPSRKRQSSPRQSQGPLADKIGRGDEIITTRETPTHDPFANPTKVVSTGNTGRSTCIRYLTITVLSIGHCQSSSKYSIESRQVYLKCHYDENRILQI